MRKGFFGFAVIATMLVPMPAAAGAATIQVNDLSDPGGPGGTCTLREAITAANGDANVGVPLGCTNGSGADTISFSLVNPATITLGGTQLPAITDPAPDTLTITGPGAGALTITGNNASRVFEVASGSALTISGVTITGGRSQGADGPAVGDPGDTGFGGGFYNAGVLSIEDTIVTGNTVVGGDGAAGNSPGVGPGDPGGFGGDSRGGGIYNQGDLTVTDATVSGNHALGGSGGAGGNGSGVGGDGGSGGAGGEGLGGGIDSFGGLGATLTVERSTLSGNEALAGAGGAGGNGAAGETRGTGGNGTEGDGGGVHNSNSPTFTIDSSTFSGNLATGSSGGAVGGGAGSGGAAGEADRGFGGGILSEITGVSLQNSTVSGNTAGSTGDAGGQGGGVWVSGGSNVLHSTLVENSAGLGGNLTTFATTSLRATIVANPAAGGNCSNTIGNVASLGFNLEDSDTCNLNPPATDLVNTEPLLGALADWGGPTKTHLPAATSPAVNAITVGCPPPNTDQRGETRTAPCDIGAVERQPGDPALGLGGGPPVQPPVASGVTGLRAAALKKCKKKKSAKARKKCKKKAKKLPL
jgi:CSLREA domain-containing protein